MILTIFLSGMVVSILLDWFYYSCATKGVEIESYPRQYLRYSKYQLFRSWVLWSLVWPIVLAMVVITSMLNWVKK